MSDSGSRKWSRVRLWVALLARPAVCLHSEETFGNHFIGNVVNAASRTDPRGDPGGVCSSGDVYDMVKKSIELQVLQLGKKELKNIQGAPDLYKIVVESVAGYAIGFAQRQQVVMAKQEIPHDKKPIGPRHHSFELTNKHSL